MLALPALSPIQKRISLLTLTFFAVLYFTSSAGLNCSNDGSHFALAKSIYYNHSTEIKPYFNYVKCCDFAEKDGKIYSDRLPGNAFLMLPFLAYSNLLQLIMPDNSGTDYEADVVFISLLPNLCGIIGLTFLFLLFRKTGFSFNLSIISTIIYGIATLQWYESAHAFSHAPSSMFVAMAVYFTILVKDVRADQKFIYFSAALIGLSTLVELQNILFLGPIFLYVFILINPSGFLEFNKWVPVMLGSVAVAVFFVGCLVLYNYITFGEFLLKSKETWLYFFR